MKILFTVQNSIEDDIYYNLYEADKEFLPALRKKANLEKFINKIMNYSTRFEAWDVQKKLIGFISVYLNNKEDKIAYINMVSILNSFTNNGIATKLLQMCIDSAKEQSFHAIKLECDKKNYKARKLYTKFNFKNKAGYSHKFLFLYL